MRLTKNDPTGSYSYLNDGFSPASAVLTDGYSTFTPGISEMNALGTRFYLADASGHSRGMLNGSNVDTDGYNWDAFGNLVSRFGSNPTMFAWNEDSGYQTDNDDGLALLGYRYYDKRTGRFISQDPAGDGDNWYGYADNDPMNDTDPTGLVQTPEQQTADAWLAFTSSDYNGQQLSYDSWGGVQFTAADGTVENFVSPSDNMFAPQAGGPGGTGASGGSGTSDMGFGGFVDDWMTFGTVQRAGQVAGDYDSGKASRGAAIGAGALAIGAVVAVAATRGEDGEAGAEARAESKIGGWIAKDVFSTLKQDVGQSNFEKFVEALQKGVVGPDGKAGIKALKGNIGYTHELKINGSGARLFGNVEEWNGVRTVIFRQLSARGLH